MSVDHDGGSGWMVEETRRTRLVAGAAAAESAAPGEGRERMRGRADKAFSGLTSLAGHHFAQRRATFFLRFVLFSAFGGEFEIFLIHFLHEQVVIGRSITFAAGILKKLSVVIRNL